MALSGDPTKSNQGLNGVIMASVANGGSVDDVSKGVDFFHQLKVAKNFVPVVGTASTVKAGQTPVLFEWDYLSASHGKDVSTWKIFVPSNAVVFGGYAQAINKQAPHPAAAAALGGVPLLGRRPEPLAQGRRAPRPPGRNDDRGDHRRDRCRSAAGRDRYGSLPD